MEYADGKVKDLQIAYIGGGSRGWAWTFMTDLAMDEELSGTIRLYDIDAEAAKHNEIIGKGMLLGNIIALGILTLQYFTGIIKLDAQTYYVSTVPVEFNWLAIIALNIATLLISIFMLVAPSYLISHIHPAKSMRYE